MSVAAYFGYQISLLVVKSQRNTVMARFDTCMQEHTSWHVLSTPVILKQAVSQPKVDSAVLLGDPWGHQC